MAPSLHLSFKSLFFTTPRKKQTPSKRRAEGSQSPRSRKAVQHLSKSLAEMVGKSNKFDFTHRTSTGVRLGTVIADAFLKEVDKAQKDADRQAAKNRKRGSIGTADSKDIGIHIIDFKAPSKDLGDEGVLAMAPGLYEAIKSGSSEAFVCLEDINLQGNELTIRSLARLARVINAAMHDLKTLNLSNNNISVVDAMDAVDWEMFLRSFQGCFKLRRLDLSGNKLGAKAFEILARVYEEEPPIVPLRLGGDVSVQSLDEEAQKDKEDMRYALEILQKGNKATTTERSLADACLLKRRRGIRSIPYLDLTDTGLTDTGALWLSFVLPQHYFPDQLIDGINGTTATSTVGIYQQVQSSAGIEWSNNEDTLGRDGLQLLWRVETIRKNTLYDNVSLGSSIDMCSDVVMHDRTIDSRTSLVSHSHETSGRKLSGRYTHALTDTEIGNAALDSIRRRLQRQIIQQQGVHSVDLWHSAVVIVSISRRLLVLERPLVGTIRQHTSPKHSLYTDADTQRHTDYRRAVLAPVPQLPDITNQIPWLKQTDNQRYPVATPVAALSKKMGKARITVPNGEQYITWQLQRDKARADKDNMLPWALPFPVFENIVRHMMSDSEITALTEKQRRAAYEFGQTRTTLTLGREWTKMNDSAQVLMLLDHIGCLAYEPRVLAQAGPVAYE